MKKKKQVVLFVSISDSLSFFQYLLS